MRGEKYDIVYDGSDRVFEAVWVPYVGILFQREGPSRIKVLEHKSFPPQGATVVSQGGAVLVLYSAIKAAQKYLQEQEEIEDRQCVLNMAQDCLDTKDWRCRERFRRHADKLFTA